MRRFEAAYPLLEIGNGLLQVFQPRFLGRVFLLQLREPGFISLKLLGGMFVTKLGFEITRQRAVAAEFGQPDECGSDGSLIVQTGRSACSGPARNSRNVR